MKNARSLRKRLIEDIINLNKNQFSNNTRGIWNWIHERREVIVRTIWWLGGADYSRIAKRVSQEIFRSERIKTFEKKISVEFFFFLKRDNVEKIHPPASLIEDIDR